MKSRIAISLCALPALLASTMQAQNRAQSAAAIPVAITNVTVIDVETGRRHLDQTVLVSGRRISAVGPSASTRVPNPARVIDGRGKFLVPGLWDMHVHSAAAAERELPVYVALGITGVRNMHTTADTALQLVAAIRRQVESGDLPGPRFIANGPIVDGPRPIHRGSVPVASPETARRVVDSLADGGADFIKVYNLLPRDAYFALAERAKQRGIPFVGHVPQDVRVEEASNAGQRSIEHLNGLPEACSSVGDSVRSARATSAGYAPADRVRAIALLAATSSPARCASAIAVLKRNTTWVTPTLVLHWVRAAADSVLENTNQMAIIPPGTRTVWQRMASERASERATARAFFDWSLAVVQQLRDGGVPILAGTDVGNPLLVPGYSLHKELELLVHAGLTPIEALRTATINPVRFLNATDSLGTIAPGKLADLLLLDADPLADIRSTTRITAVIANGRVVDGAMRERLLGGER